MPAEAKPTAGDDEPTLILASGSPRRRELLAAAGYEFTVLAPHDGVEDPGRCSGCGPAELVVGLAEQKLADVVEQLGESPTGGRAIVLAADTVAECDGAILGKPRDEDHAAAMLGQLSGRRHRVYTGIALAVVEGAGSPKRTQLLPTEADVTTLRMDPLDEAWVDAYLDGGAWRGKAGAFGFQDDLGVVHVERGSESNVVGLPMERVVARLAELGVTPKR